jgi:hypothetical protein
VPFLPEGVVREVWARRHESFNWARIAVRIATADVFFGKRNLENRFKGTMGPAMQMDQFS